MDGIGMKIVIVGAVLVIPVGTFLHIKFDDYRARQAAVKQQEQARLKQQQQQREAQVSQQILNQAEALLPRCQQQGSVGLHVCPRIIIWDVNTRARHPANALLPSERQGTLIDPAFTLLLVTRRNEVKTRTYSSNGQFGRPGFPGDGIAGYRVDVDVCVVQWPEQQAVGAATVRGDEPAESIRRAQFDNRPEYGAIDGPLARWAAGLKH